MLRLDRLPIYTSLLRRLPYIALRRLPILAVIKVSSCLYFYILISTDVKLTTYRPSLVTSYYVAYPDTNGRRHLPIHRSSPSERDAYHTTHHAAVCLLIYQVASPVAYADTNGRRQCLPIHRCVPTDTSRTSPTTPADTTRPLPQLQRATSTTQDISQSTTMVERACGCVPCVACKRMFKGDRGLWSHASRTGCGHRWVQMDGTTYDKRWNEMMQTLPCSCAMK